MTNTKRIGELPRPTMAQRLKSLSEDQLMAAARKLAPQTTTPEMDALDAVMNELENRMTARVDVFELFVEEISVLSSVNA